MSITEGRARRDVGIEATDAAGVAAHKKWRPKADNAMQELIRRRQPFTADDLDDLVGEKPGHPNQIGALFMAAARRGQIRKLGYQQARAASRRAGNLAVWRAA